MDVLYRVQERITSEAAKVHLGNRGGSGVRLPCSFPPNAPRLPPVFCTITWNNSSVGLCGTVGHALVTTAQRLHGPMKRAPYLKAADVALAIVSTSCVTW